MSFHVAANFVSLGNVANTDAPPVTDDILQIQNAHFVLSQPMLLLAAYASDLTLTRARINSPTFRQVAPKYIRPINGALLPANNPNVDWQFGKPFTIPAQEEIVLELTSSAIGPTNAYAVMMLATQVTPAPQGQVYITRFTSVGPAVANKWATIAYALESSLPAGRYSMVFAEVQSANCIAHRWIFDNQNFRPGFLGQATLVNRVPYDAYSYNLGEFGLFTTISLPRLQVLCDAADVAFEGYIYCVKVG